MALPTRLRRATLRLEALEARALLAAGALDPTFGSGGNVATDLLGPASEYGRAVAVWDAGTPTDVSDDKVVAAGSAAVAGDLASVFAVTRHNADGTPDASFGTGGVVTTRFGAGAAVSVGVVVQAAGKVVVAGTYTTSTGSDVVLARYNLDGSLDAAFGTGGRVTTNLGSTEDFATRMTLDGSGRVVVVGATWTPLRGRDLAVVRYTTGGVLDTSFSGDGKVTTNLGAGDRVAGVAIQPDGKLVAAGTATLDPEFGSDFVLARYESE